MDERKKLQQSKTFLGIRWWYWLTLILILIILASIIIPVEVYNSLRVQRGSLHARHTALDLRTALMNYRTEYRQFPPLRNEGADTKVITDGSDGLISALMAIPEAASASKLNKRGILFFSGKKAKTEIGFGIYFDGSSHRLNDPWGNPFVIVYDSNYDNKIEVPDRDGDGTQEIHANVAVWSYGPNGVPGKGEDRRNDDIYSYQ